MSSSLSPPALSALPEERKIDLAVAGGGDYELLLTMSEESFREAIKIPVLQRTGLTQIGRITGSGKAEYLLRAFPGKCLTAGTISGTDPGKAWLSGKFQDVTEISGHEIRAELSDVVPVVVAVGKSDRRHTGCLCRQDIV